jgi:hypothetical protein
MAVITRIFVQPHKELYSSRGFRLPPPVGTYRYSVAREIGRVLQKSSLGAVLSGVNTQECAAGCLAGVYGGLMFKSPETQ